MVSTVDPTDAATWPAQCPDCRAALTRTRQCLGHKSDGTHCTRVALRGQTKCSFHGGNSPQAKRKAQERIERAEAERQVAALALTPRAIDPHDALLEEVQRTIAWVDLLESLVRRDGEDGITQWGMAGRTESAYWSMLVEQRKHLVATAKACVVAGIAERQVQIAEAHGRMLAEVVRTIVEGLGRDLDDPEVRQVVEPALRLVRPAA